MIAKGSGMSEGAATTPACLVKTVDPQFRILVHNASLSGLGAAVGLDKEQG